MQKVRLPKAVAKEIEWIRSSMRPTNYDIIMAATTKAVNANPNLKYYADFHFNELLKALVFGYEVEETTEEKVRNYYETLIRERDRTDIRKGVCHAATLTARIDTLMEVLHMQGTTYKGVNDHGES